MNLHPKDGQSPSSRQAALRPDIEALYARYAHIIDDDRLEDWPELFVEDGTYRVTTRENHDNGLALGIMYCSGRGMMADRISALRQANVFEPHVYCHLTSNVAVLEASSAEIRARANCAALSLRHFRLVFVRWRRADMQQHTRSAERPAAACGPPSMIPFRECRIGAGAPRAHSVFAKRPTMAPGEAEHRDPLSPASAHAAESAAGNPPRLSFLSPLRAREGRGPLLPASPGLGGAERPPGGTGSPCATPRSRPHGDGPAPRFLSDISGWCLSLGGAPTCNNTHGQQSDPLPPAGRRR